MTSLDLAKALAAIRRREQPVLTEKALDLVKRGPSVPRPPRQPLPDLPPEDAGRRRHVARLGHKCSGFTHHNFHNSH